MLGNALARLGDPEAFAVLEQALELTDRPADRLAVVEASTDPLAGAGRVDQARRLVTAALAEVGADDPESVTRLAARLAMLHALYGPGAGDAFVEALRQRASTLQADSFSKRYAAAALALLCAYGDGSAAEVRRLARLAVGDPERHAADAEAGQPLHIALIALALAGEPQLALRRCTAGIEASRARGSLMGQAMGLGWRAQIHMVGGRVAEAENDGRAARAGLADTGLDALAAAAAAPVAWALIERGQAREALDVVAAARAAGPLEAVLGCLRAWALLASHRPREALDAPGRVAQLARGAGWRNSCVLPWRPLRVSAMLALGDTSSGGPLAAEELAEAERFGLASDIGRALRLVALVEEDPQARGLAITILRDADAALELAYALVDEGAELRRAGQRTSARGPLHEAMELAEGCGATALVERARIELRAAGARPRSVARSGIEALTPSEQRIAEMAAEGLSNREIAQALFITVRTVEMHLTAAYRKLDVTSRKALPAALSAVTSASH